MGKEVNMCVNITRTSYFLKLFQIIPITNIRLKNSVTSSFLQMTLIIADITFKTNVFKIL